MKVKYGDKKRSEGAIMDDEREKPESPGMPGLSRFEREMWAKIVVGQVLARRSVYGAAKDAKDVIEKYRAFCAEMCSGIKPNRRNITMAEFIRMIKRE